MGSLLQKVNTAEKRHNPEGENVQQSFNLGGGTSVNAMFLVDAQ